MYYTGVGSRETPQVICCYMSKIAKVLASRGHVLRSGGAGGADQAFENGHLLVNENLQSFIPWKGFARDKKGYHHLITDEIVTQKASQIASEVHPAWDRCSSGAKLLHTRNVYQVLGADLQTPSSFVLCWTKGGEPVGGTRTAIVIAQQNSVPVFNLYGLEELGPLGILKAVAKNIKETL